MPWDLPKRHRLVWTISSAKSWYVIQTPWYLKENDSNVSPWVAHSREQLGARPSADTIARSTKRRHSSNWGLNKKAASSQITFSNISFSEESYISTTIPLESIPKVHNRATSHYLDQRWPKLVKPYCSTGPQWAIITMTSNKHHVVSNHRSFDCLFNSLCEATSKKFRPSWGEFTGDRWIPRTKGQWRGKRLPFEDVIINMTAFYC